MQVINSQRKRRLFFLELPQHGQKSSAFQRFGIPCIAFVCAFFIRYLVPQEAGQASLILFVPAILIAAWFGGFRSGALASVVALAVTNYFFVFPFKNWSSWNLHHVLSGLSYLFAAFIVTGLANSLRREQQRLATESNHHLNRAESLQREILRREAAEQLLRDRETHLRLIFENARGVAIISFDLDGNISDWNEGAERVFGYRDEEILGHHCSQLFTPEDRATNYPETELREAREKKSAEANRWHLAKGDRRIHLDGVTCAKFGQYRELIGYLKIARDNTERQKMEEALAQSEWRFRKIFESAAIGIVQVDVQGRFINANENFCKITGYSLEELRRIKNFFELFLPEERAGYVEEFEQLLKGVIPVCDGEKRCICKNGNIIWIHAAASFLRDELGNPIHNIAIVEDITGRKESEKKLQKSEERLRLATESADIGLWQWDIESGEQDWSPIARQHLGKVSNNKASLEKFMTSLHPDDLERVQNLCSEAIRQRAFLDIEYRVIWPDKSVHWIWGKGRFMSESAGLNNVFIGVTMDITEQKKSAEQLQKAVSLYRTILESTDDGILVVDLSGKVVAYNEKFGRLWQIPEEMLSQNDDKILLCWVGNQLLQSESFFNKVQFLMSSEVDDRDELRFKDGRVFARFSQPHRISQKIVGRVWSFRDITDLTRAREKLIAHSEELEHHVADRTVMLQKALGDMETFLYAIAHDLRAPLRAMSGFIDLLAEEYATQLDDTAKDYCRRINASAFRMNSLISDILAYGRLTHTEFPKYAVDLSGEVEKVIANSAFQIAERHGVVKVNKPMPKVMADAAVLDQVIENLLTNAMKFVPAERDPQLNIYAEEDENNVRLFFDDNGIGIDPEDQSRIFGPFQRLHSTEEYPGTGIGLAIVQCGIEKMGGHVGVESIPGKGSHFWVELPKEKWRQ